MFAVIASACYLIAALTLFTGFGLGTLLMPVLAIFFPVSLAIALTAVIHLINNLMKLVLYARFVDRNLIVKFGIPAMAGSFLGAICLQACAAQPPMISYSVGPYPFKVEGVKVLIAGVILLFIAIENMRFSPAWCKHQSGGVVAGLTSGFFGGLSGHQGAFRSIFLKNLDLPKETFIGTGVFLACLVDIVRLFVYAHQFSAADIGSNWKLLVICSAASFLGIYTANLFLPKVQMPHLRRFISHTLVMLAFALALGLI